MYTDKKISKAQSSKTIRSGGFLNNKIGKLGKEALINLAVPLAKDFLTKLATKATSHILDKFERKLNGSWAIRICFTSFILNENMDDIIKIAQSLENSGLLTDGATETVKHKMKE